MLVATCARVSGGCEFATHCAPGHAANRTSLCQLPLAGACATCKLVACTSHAFPFLPVNGRRALYGPCWLYRRQPSDAARLVARVRAQSASSRRRPKVSRRGPVHGRLYVAPCAARGWPAAMRTYAHAARKNNAHCKSGDVRQLAQKNFLPGAHPACRPR